MDNSKIDRMRERARQMRRAAAMSHNSEIIQILTMAANEAEADAAEMELELRKLIQDLPPQS